MSLTSDTPPDQQALDADTTRALADHVAAAKTRGWAQADLQRFFGARGIAAADYKQAVAGEAVTSEVAGFFTGLSITGLPERPHQPNIGDIAMHLAWLTAPAIGAYDDALVEIAYGAPDVSPNRAKLFGLDELEEAVDFAAERNAEGSNVYVGAALRLPDTPRNHRASAEHFYVATAVPVDIDTDYDATRARMATAVQDGLVVVTGLTPQRRSQHWARLDEPCDDELDFGHAFAALVHHVGADKAVKDAARIMRLGGTVSYPNARKVGLGYCVETTAVHVSATARPASIDALKALEPTMEVGERFDASTRPAGDAAVDRDWTGRVTDGRELHFRSIVLSVVADYQASTGSDPEFSDVWEAAWASFNDPAKVDNADGRWTSQDGQRQLQARIHNTLRRLRTGRLARVGLYSIDTGAGQEEARAVQANRAATLAIERPVTVIDPVAKPRETVAPGAAKTLRLMDWTADRYAGEAEPIEWLCEGTVPLGIPVLFAAMGGMGKSFMALDAALEVAVGVTSVSPRAILGGLVVQQGTAVVISAEDSRASIHRRLEKIDPERRRLIHPERLIIVPLPELDGPMPLIASDGRTLSCTPAFYALRDQLAEIADLKLIVIDPLQAFVMADVNADPAAGQFMWSAFASLCAATGATLIVPHHMRKQGAMTIKTPDEAREAIRGSTALVDGARLTFALWKTDDADARDICARMDIDYEPDMIAGGAVVKANDEANRGVRTYVRQDSGLLIDATDRLSATAPGEGVSMKVAQDIIIEIGRAFDDALAGRGEGFAMSPQSGDRQAWKLIKRRSGCSVKEAKGLAEAWVANGILQMQLVDAKRHRNALRMVGSLG